MKRKTNLDPKLEKAYREFREELKKHNPYKGMTAQQILDQIRGR